LSARTRLAGDGGDHFLEAADIGRDAEMISTRQPCSRRSAGTCAEVAAKSAASSPPVPARISEHGGALVGRVAGQQLDGSARSASGSLLAISSASLPPSRAARLGRRRRSSRQALALGAQPAHFARRGGDRLDRGIVLGQRTNSSGARLGAAMAAELVLARLDRRDPLRRDRVMQPRSARARR
jgi:hypothetical protein